MSDAKMKSVEHKKQAYLDQNMSQAGGRPLTVAQERQLRKTKTRLDAEQSHGILRERQRNARQRFREWMAGMRG